MKIQEKNEHIENAYRIQLVVKTSPNKKSKNPTLDLL